MSVEQDMVRVDGFFEPAATNLELRERIETAIAEQRAAEQQARDAPPAPPAPPVLSATPPGSVEEQWGRVLAWLEENLPAAHLVGADAEAIARAEEATGVEWPAELVDLYRSVNGFPGDQWVPILPMHAFLDLDQMLEDRQMMIDTWGGLDDAGLGEAAAGSQAGEGAGTFLPEFIPFAGLDGYFLFIDTRPGALYGSVTEFDKADADAVGPRWRSISAMLADLADSLENGTVFDGLLSPVMVDGNLEWE